MNRLTLKGIDEDDDEIEEQYVDDAFDNNGEEVDD
jgi:hypothetical protein